MLDHARSAIKWSDVFEGERFASDKKTFDDLVARMREQAYEGDLSPKVMREARDFVKDLSTKLEAQPLKDPAHQKEAVRFITACSSLLNLLERPSTGPALLQLRKIQDTMVANLLGFMHAYNLRFGPATTPDQRQVYAKLFAILDQARDQTLAEVNAATKALPEAKPDDATDFLNRVEKAPSPSGAGAQSTPAPKP